MQYYGSKDQWKPVIHTACWWQGREQSDRLAVCGSSKRAEEAVVDSGMNTEKHAAQQSFMGMAEVVTYAAGLVPVLGRSE